MSIREQVLGGVTYRVAQPITFTPYAAPTPCPAHCVFCSERLIERGALARAGALRPSREYHSELRRSLAALRGLPMGLSLSGLEATSDLDWLDATLGVLADHELAGNPFQGKVLYSNGHGFTRDGARLTSALQRFGLDRVELSRHAADEARNAALMRFRPTVSVAENRWFEAAVAGVKDQIELRLVCVPQRGGVEDPQSLAEYLAWARGLGVRGVVFRELAQLGDAYARGSVERYHAAGRVPVATLAGWLLGGVAGRFRRVAHEDGYYYSSERFDGEDGLRVALEASSYELMHQRHRSGVVHKLVHHTNGNLCGGWNPEQDVLLRAAAGDAARPSRSPLGTALALLRALQQRGVDSVLIGTSALELSAPHLLDEVPSDCDILIGLTHLEEFVRLVEAAGYEVTSWGESVTAPLNRAELAGRYYLRATPRDGGLVIDATYESPWLDFEGALSRAVYRRGVRVAAVDDVLTLKAKRGTERDRRVLARAGWVDAG